MSVLSSPISYSDSQTSIWTLSRIVNDTKPLYIICSKVDSRHISVITRLIRDIIQPDSDEGDANAEKRYKKKSWTDTAHYR